MMRTALLTGALLVVGACSPAADKQRAEEAVNRGEAVPAATAQDGFGTTCASAGGNWDATARQCMVTATMCASFGEWRDGIGCVVPATGNGSCEGMSGLKVVGDMCVLAHVTHDDVTTI